MNLNEKTTLSSFIRIYSSVISEILCQDILEEYLLGSWVPSNDGMGNVYGTRKCDLIPVSQKDVWEQGSYNMRKHIDEILYSSFSSVSKLYAEEFNFPGVNSDTGYDLLRYNTGSLCEEHIDSMYLQPRSITSSILLNDDYEGGDFFFFGGSIKYTMKRGDAIVFPSNFMFPHGVSEITKGTRFSVVTWFL